MKVSVIIPCYNAKKTIKACIGSVIKQDYPDFEVIVVDDASTDGTPDLLKDFDRIRLKVLAENGGPSVARNEGVKVASGELIIFLDSDCTVADPHWIQKHLEAHADHERKLVGGSVDADGKGLAVKAFRYNNWYVCHPGRKTMPWGVRHLQTTNLSLRKALFYEIGPFDESLRSSEDTEFSVRAGRKGVRMQYVREIQVEHINRTRMSEFLEVNFRYGLSRITAKRMGIFPASFLLPENIFLNALMLLPLSGILTARVFLSWVGYDLKILFYLPLVFIGQFCMAFGTFRFLLEEHRSKKLCLSKQPS